LFWFLHAIILILVFVTSLESDTGKEAAKWIKGVFVFCVLLAIGTWGYQKFGHTGSESDDEYIRTITVTSHWGTPFVPPREWAGRKMDWTRMDPTVPYQVATQSDTITYGPNEKNKDVGMILSLNFKTVGDTSVKVVIRAHKL
jgi:hypothetical protein